MSSTSSAQGSSEQRTAMKALDKVGGKVSGKTWSEIRRRLGLTRAMNTATLQATFGVLGRLEVCEVSAVGDDIVVRSAKRVAQDAAQAAQQKAKAAA